jgi:hypothetical protein
MKRRFPISLHLYLFAFTIWSLSFVHLSSAEDQSFLPQPVEFAETATSTSAAELLPDHTQAQIDRILRRHPGGVQMSDHEIAWDDGAVMLVLPTDQASFCFPGSGCVHGCPSGWYCFYQYRDFGGRRLQFRDCSRGGTIQFLTDYGFGNRTSSWVVNRSLNFVNVNDSDSGRNLWNEHSHSVSRYVGSAADNKADWFICYG